MKTNPSSDTTHYPAVPEHCIRERAYEIYNHRGRADGHALSDWFTAEAELKELKKKVENASASVAYLYEREETMTTIREDDFSVALVNTFYVKPGKAEELVQLLVKATDEVMRHQKGFISANIHISLDKTRVLNYAQWRSKEDFEAMQSNPETQAHMKAAAALAERFDPMLFTVTHVDNRANV